MLQGMVSGVLLVVVFAAVTGAGVAVAVRLYRGTRPAEGGPARAAKPAQRAGDPAAPPPTGGSLNA